MEITVADVAEDRRNQTAVGNVALRLGDARGELRDRHADVGRKRLRAGAQRPAGPIGVVAGLPELCAVLAAGGPVERPAAELARDLGEFLALLGHPGLTAVELDAEQRPLGKREL